MNRCQVCRSEAVREPLDLGPQPICNRFVTDAQATEYRYPMVVGQCGICGLVQIADPVPAAELRPRVDWITYSEPEPHLDALVQRVVKLPGITRDSRVGGVSFKDDSTLERLNRLGYENTWRLDPCEDLAIRERGVGVETIQSRLEPSQSSQVAGRKGASDVMLVRHIIEHAHDLPDFMGGIASLLSEAGYAVFEAPDCEPAFSKLEFTTLWEEHTAYFTPVTFRHSLEIGGFEVVDEYVHPYPFENSLIVIAKRGKKTAPVLAPRLLEKEKERFEAFAHALSDYGARIRAFLERERTSGGKVALFGAGHLTATYVNIFDLAPYIEFVADDNPNKVGLMMPGSKLPIRGSASLQSEGITFCLLGLNPQSEDKVIGNNSSFTSRGGRFASIFSTSPKAVQV